MPIYTLQTLCSLTLLNTERLILAWRSRFGKPAHLHLRDHQAVCWLSLSLRLLHQLLDTASGRGATVWHNGTTRKFLDQKGYYGASNADVLENTSGKQYIVDLNVQMPGSYVFGAFMTHFLAQCGLMSATMQSESLLRRWRESFTRGVWGWFYSRQHHYDGIAWRWAFWKDWSKSSKDRWFVWNPGTSCGAASKFLIWARACSRSLWIKLEGTKKKDVTAAKVISQCTYCSNSHPDSRIANCDATTSISVVSHGDLLASSFMWPLYSQRVCSVQSMFNVQAIHIISTLFLISKPSPPKSTAAISKAHRYLCAIREPRPAAATIRLRNNWSWRFFGKERKYWAVRPMRQCQSAIVATLVNEQYEINVIWCSVKRFAFKKRVEKSLQSWNVNGLRRRVQSEEALRQDEEMRDG